MAFICIAALLAYVSSVLLSTKALLIDQAPSRLGQNLSFGALGLHGLTLVLLSHNTEWGFWAVVSAVSWLIALLLTVLRRPLHSGLLLPMSYGCAAVTMVIAVLLPKTFQHAINTQPALWIHISLALMAYAVLMIAALFALQLAYFKRRLKRHALKNLPPMPPLLIQEQRSHQLVTVGFGLLSASLLTGFIFMDGFFGHGQGHKAILSLAAWVCYGVLLLGCRFMAWHGQRIVGLHGLGIALLTLAYFGSRFVTEFILH